METHLKPEPKSRQRRKKRLGDDSAFEESFLLFFFRGNGAQPHRDLALFYLLYPPSVPSSSRLISSSTPISTFAASFLYLRNLHLNFPLPLNLCFFPIL